MTPQLGGAEIEALSAQAWTLMATEADGTLREWAEVPFVPFRVPEQGPAQPYRYLAIRIRPAQGTLFFDGAAVRHEAGGDQGLADRDGGLLLADPAGEPP